MPPPSRHGREQRLSDRRDEDLRSSSTRTTQKGRWSRSPTQSMLWFWAIRISAELDPWRSEDHPIPEAGKLRQRAAHRFRGRERGRRGASLGPTRMPTLLDAPRRCTARHRRALTRSGPRSFAPIKHECLGTSFPLANVICAPCCASSWSTTTPSATTRAWTTSSPSPAAIRPRPSDASADAKDSVACSPSTSEAPRESVAIELWDNTGRAIEPGPLEGPQLELPTMDGGVRRARTVDAVREKYGYDAVHLATTVERKRSRRGAR